MFKKFQVEDLVQETDSKIVMLIMDGVGDIPHPDHDFKTPLEAANTPNLDKLTEKSILGRLVPVHYGITPGSGPGHLGLFGYDPRNYSLGRGVMEALGLDIQLFPSDVVARGNFVTQDENEIIINRRGGEGEEARLSTQETKERVALLNEKVKKILSIEILLTGGLDHRFVTIFRGREMRSSMSDSDPQKTGVRSLKINALDSNSQISAQIANEFIGRANKALVDYKHGNGVVLRGFSKKPNWPTMKQRFKLKACAIAEYPMYRGIAQVLGMAKLQSGPHAADAFNSYIENYEKFNFFFIHIKKTDSHGESGLFDKKVKVIEDVDSALPVILDQIPDVLVITGDHSTPVLLKAHSWHPVPILIHSPYCGADQTTRFTENECNVGGLSTFPARHMMNVILANAMKLEKYGA